MKSMCEARLSTVDFHASLIDPAPQPAQPHHPRNTPDQPDQPERGKACDRLGDVYQQEFEEARDGYGDVEQGIGRSAG